MANSCLSLRTLVQKAGQEKKIEEMELVKICRGLEKRGGGQKWIYREEILVAPCRLISHSNAKYLQGEGNFYY